MLSGRRKLLACSCLAVAVAVCAAGAALGEAGARPAMHGASVGKFPLWKLLPTKAFATLDRGAGTEMREWAAYAYRPSSVHEASSKPCVDIVSVTAEGSFPSDVVCGHVQPSIGSPDGSPRFALISRSYGDIASKRTLGESVFAVTLPLSAVRVLVRLENTADGRQVVRTVSSEVLSPRQEGKAELAPLRFAVLSIEKSICVSSIAGFDSKGSTLFDAEEGECPLGGG